MHKNGYICNCFLKNNRSRLELKGLIGKISPGILPPSQQLEELLCGLSESDSVCGELMRRAAGISEGIFGNRIYLRGLVEIGNVCRNDCYYCGIKRIKFTNGHSEIFKQMNKLSSFFLCDLIHLFMRINAPKPYCNGNKLMRQQFGKRIDDVFIFRRIEIP